MFVCDCQHKAAARRVKHRKNQVQLAKTKSRFSMVSMVNRYGSPADTMEFYIRELALTRLIRELALPVCTSLELQCQQLKGPT